MLKIQKARTAGTARPAIGRPRKLTREDIIEGAIGLVEKRGPQALTTRALGNVLRVQASTIYNYFPSVAAINEEIGRKLLADVPLPGSSTASARDQLIAHYMAMRSVLARHPRVLDHVPGSASWIWSLQKLEGELALMGAAGVDAETSLMAVRVLDVTCAASAQLAREWNASETVSRRKRLFTGARPNEFPHVRAMHDLMIARLPDEQAFRATLETLIDSLLPQLRVPRRKS